MTDKRRLLIVARRAVGAAAVALTVIGCGSASPPPSPSTPPSPTVLPPPAPGTIRLVNMIPESMSGETWQDSEPFLAVSPSDPQLMVASAFTPNPAGPTSPLAPIFLSEDGGQSWRLCVVVPSQSMTSDITVAFADQLYGGIMSAGDRAFNQLLTGTAALRSCTITMTVRGSRPAVDQPFVQAAAAAGQARVYIGGNDFDAGDRTATVDVSGDGGQTFRPIRVERRATSGQNGPSVRPAASADGTVYAAFFGWRTFTGGIATSDVVVVRDDAGALGPQPFESLTDTATDDLPGRRIVRGVQIPWSNAPTLGQERIGSTLSLAVHPTDSSTVHVAWGDRVGNGDIYTLHVRRSTDRGVTWSADLRTIVNATNVALAIAANGTVGLLYQQVRGTGAAARWETHLEQSRDGFASLQDTLLANVPANDPPMQFLPYIGDYTFLAAVGNEFRGVFSTSNAPDPAHFPHGVSYQRRSNFTTRRLEDETATPVATSIDPFYFGVPVLP
jgi:hypothetical protein